MELRLYARRRQQLTDNPTIAVVGAGVMGTGISTVIVGQGLPVVLVDVDEAALQRARGEIRVGVRHAQLMSAVPAEGPSGRLRTTQALSAIGGAIAVIEAVTESLETKSKLLAEAAGLVGSDVPLISNTSGIPIDELAEAVPCPGVLIGTHFMNP